MDANDEKKTFLGVEIADDTIVRKNIFGLEVEYMELDKVLFREECYVIVGICMKIHSILGKGFKEIVYKDALEVELMKNKIEYQREKTFPINYEGVILRRKFTADFLVYDSIILEIKSQFSLAVDSFKQTLNYLKASEIKLGILINFGEDRLTFQRIICSR